MNLGDIGGPSLSDAVLHYRAYVSTGCPDRLRTAVELVAKVQSTGDDLIRREYLVDRVRLTGWAGLPGEPIGIRRVVACSSKRILGSAIPNRRRPDVVRHFGDERLRRSGFGHRDLLIDQPLDDGPVWVLAETDDHRFVPLRPTDSVLEYGDSLLVIDPNPLIPESDLFGGHVDGMEVERVALFDQREDSQEIDLVALAELLVLNGNTGAARRVLDQLPPASESDVQRRATLAFATTPKGQQVEPPLASEATWAVVPVHRPTPPVDVPNYVDSVWTPKSIPHKKRERRSIRIPEPFVTRIQDAEIHHGSVIRDATGALVLDETAANPAFDFVAGRWQHIFGSPTRLGEALLRLPVVRERRIDEAASLLGRCSFNYFHSLIEYIPRIVAIEQWNPTADVPVLINDDLPPAVHEALTMLSGDRMLIPIASDESVSVGLLHVPSFHTYHPDTPALPWVAGAGVHRPTLLEVRERWLAAAEAVPGDRRVLLMRGTGVRGLSNSAGIRHVARRQGFEEVDPSELSFAEQVRLVHGAKIITGVGGAAFANLLFCRPGTRVVGMVSNQLADFSIQAHLAHIVGARFTYVTGPSLVDAEISTNHRDHFHADFRIPLLRYRGALRQAVRGLE